jgi:DNA-binding transcriptional LysR family regulator
MLDISAVNFRTLDLNLLRVLDTLLELRSTTAAGERLGLSQPAVSAALRRLRDHLEDEILVREGNGMVLTAFARSLQLPVREALGALEQALSGGPQFDPTRSDRTFRIFGSDFFSELLIPRLADRLAALAPGIRLQLIHHDERYFVEQLSDDAIDMALLPLKETGDWVERRTAFHSTFVAVAGTGHARLARAGVRPGDVIPLDLYCDLRHVRFSPEGVLRGMEDEALARIGRERRIMLTLPEFYGVGRSVAQTDLLAVLPSRFAVALSSRLGLEIYRIPHDMPLARLCLYWHRRHSRDAAHRWMRDQVLDLLAPLDEVAHPLDWGGSGPPR